ncbi:MAG TPA: HAD family phosphatase [Chthoniobacterales bacterium]|nr:HAD family phosphatase [Chthoniobacterales bacterium]
MSIDALIFDIGNVLVPFDWRPAESRLRERCKNFAGKSVAEFKEHIRRLDLGELTGKEFSSITMPLIGFLGDETEFVAIWNSIFTANPTMERAIENLKGRYPLFLISNISDLHLGHLMQNYDVLGHFADGVYSFRARCAKPDRKIFEIALDQFGVNPATTAFVDDLAVNVLSASGVGLKAIQYDFKNHGAFEEAFADLGIRL